MLFRDARARGSSMLLVRATKKRQLFNRLILAAFLLTLAFWMSRGWHPNTVTIEVTVSQQPHDAVLALVPRGQTYFNMYPQSNRFTSDDTWRPPELFGSNQMIINRKHSAPHFHQELPQDHVAGGDRVLLLVKTSMATMWKRMPVHMFTTFSQFENIMLYSDGPDSIGGIEVIDVISHIDPAYVRSSKQLDYYRIHRSLRDKHVYIGPDQVNVGGGHLVDKFKSLPLLLHAYTHHYESVNLDKEDDDPLVKVKTKTKTTKMHEDPYDWYVLIDDDTQVLGHSLLQYLQKLDPTKELYLGSAIAGLNYVFAHGGSAVVLSKAVMKKAFGGPQARDRVNAYNKRTEAECCGDYMISVYLKEQAQIDLDVAASGGHFQGNQVWSMPLGAHNWCKQIFTFHQQKPRDIELLWEYQRVKDDNLLYSDIYLDFVKPYFPPGAQRNWDNFARDVEYSPGHQTGENSDIFDTSAPYASFDNCQDLCHNRFDCLMFRYDPYKRYCGLGISTISLGSPVMRYDDKPNPELCEKYKVQCGGRPKDASLVSVWYLERVRSMRQTLECDPLFGDPDAEGSMNGALDQTEGWWLRAKERYGKVGDPLA